MAKLEDALGQRGEATFRVLITKFHAGRGPLFNPQFLGDKWPAVDFIVELFGAALVVPYFFVQVKATRAGYTQRDRRLKVVVPRLKVLGLAAYPAPTYVVGIDESAEQGYVVSARGPHAGGLPSLSTRYPIDVANREALWEEVRSFWQRCGPGTLNSRFVDPEWR